MKLLLRLAVRAAALVAAFVVITSLSTTANAACWNDQMCRDLDEPLEDYCYGDSGTSGSHCHLNHGVCAEGSGNCEI